MREEKEERERGEEKEEFEGRRESGVGRKLKYSNLENKINKKYFWCKYPKTHIYVYFWCKSPRAYW